MVSFFKMMKANPSAVIEADDVAIVATDPMVALLAVIDSPVRERSFVN